MSSSSDREYHRSPNVAGPTARRHERTAVANQSRSSFGAPQGIIARLHRTVGNQAVQRLFAAAPTSDSDGDIGQRIRSASGGVALEANVQRGLEQQLGADLSSVRVHADSHADALARQVNATAFTSGSDIFFRTGAYNPSSAAGRHTLAHEAVHVVQQASGPVAGSPAQGGISLSDPSDAYERTAEATASAVEL